MDSQKKIINDYENTNKKKKKEKETFNSIIKKVEKENLINKKKNYFKELGNFIEQKLKLDEK